MSYIFFALIASFSFAMGAIINKFAAKHGFKSLDKLWVYFLVSFAPLPIIFAPLVATISFPSTALVPLFFNSLLFVIGVWLFFRSLQSVDASVATPFFQLQSAAIVILAFLFLGERFPIQNYLWIALIILGALIVSVDEKLNISSFFKAGIRDIVIANLFFATSNLSVGFAIQRTSIWNVLFWTPFINLFFVAIFLVAKRPNLKATFKKVLPMLFSGFFQFVGVTSIFVAYQTNISISAVLSTLSAPFVFVIAVISSRFYPRFLEHHSAKVYAIRGLGLTIILFAAIKLALGQ